MSRISRSMRQHRSSSGVKCRYLTYQDARAAAKRRMEEWNRDFSAYECPICNYYHIGNSKVRAKGRGHDLESLLVEMNIREAMQLLLENEGAPATRIKNIGFRTRAAEERRLGWTLGLTPGNRLSFKRNNNWRNLASQALSQGLKLDKPDEE